MSALKDCKQYVLFEYFHTNFDNVLRNMFLQGIFPKPLEVSEKSLRSKQSKNCQNMRLEFYGLTRKLFIQMGVEFVYLNGISYTVSKK
jgi:hypothetical protein